MNEVAKQLGKLSDTIMRMTVFALVYITQLLLITLKLTGFLNWSWLLVTAPTWIWLGIFVIMFVFVASIALISYVHREIIDPQDENLRE